RTARLPADSPQPIGARLLDRILRAHVGDVCAARLGRRVSHVRGRPDARRVDAAGARHRRQRDGPSRRMGQRVGERARHSIRPPPLHLWHTAQLRRAGGRDWFQRGAAVRGRRGAHPAVRDLIWSDSSSLTAGSAGSADPGRRGATLAVHSTLGYAGGFLGPLVLGATLDLVGGASAIGWGIAFGHVTVALLVGALAFVWLRPADLAGDRPALAVQPGAGNAT